MRSDYDSLKKILRNWLVDEIEDGRISVITNHYLTDKINCLRELTKNETFRGFFNFKSDFIDSDFTRLETYIRRTLSDFVK